MSTPVGEECPNRACGRLDLAATGGRRQDQGVRRDRVRLGANLAEGERNALTGAGLRDPAMDALRLGDAAELALQILGPRHAVRRAGSG